MGGSVEGCRPGVLTLDPVGESRDGELLKHQVRAPAHPPECSFARSGWGGASFHFSSQLGTAALDHCFSTFLKTCLFDKQKTQCFSS